MLFDDRLLLTSAFDRGARRVVHCLDRRTGDTLWRRETGCDNPEITSSLTGHAASTPVTDGRLVVVWFGNAGVACYGLEGDLRWRREFGDFESELGLASSPILHGDSVILVCDHDGNRFSTFDSFLVALDLETGRVRWRTDRPKLYRSWSTPIVTPAPGGAEELIVSAQDELRGYDPGTGRQLWRVRGQTGWVTPSPVFAQGMIFAVSGKDGPTLAVRPGGRGDVTETHVVWRRERGSPYVCSPLAYRGRLYVHNEQGVLHCYRADTGQPAYRRRLPGKFTASGVAGDGKIYLTSEAGRTYVIAAGPAYRLLAANSLDEECLASPAVSGGSIFLRTRSRLYCIGGRR